MGMIDLGKVKGEDAHFGAINATYTNDGGNPSVNIETDGEDTGKNVTFNFRNLVNDPLSESEIEQITEGNSIQSSNVMNGTRASALWSKIVEKFAAKLHKHKADDIDEGQFGTDRIEDGAITKNKIAANSVGLNQLDESARDSLSRINDGRILSSNDNVDGVINAGAYMVANAAGIPNGAYNYGVLVVFKVPNGLTCLQVYVTDALEQKTYVRSRFNGASWRPWCLLQAAS